MTVAKKKNRRKRTNSERELTAAKILLLTQILSLIEKIIDKLTD